MTSSVVVRQPGEGEVLRAGPTVSVVKVAGTSTDDRLGVVEMHLEAGWDGPPATDSPRAPGVRAPRMNHARATAAARPY